MTTELHLYFRKLRNDSCAEFCQRMVWCQSYCGSAFRSIEIAVPMTHTPGHRRYTSWIACRIKAHEIVKDTRHCQIHIIF